MTTTFITTHDAGVPPAPPEAHQRAELVMCADCCWAVALDSEDDPSREVVLCDAFSQYRAAALERTCSTFVYLRR